MHDFIDLIKNFTLPGIIYKLVANNDYKTDSIKISVSSEYAKKYESFIDNTYKKEAKVLIQKCTKLGTNATNVKSVLITGKARKNIKINLDNKQENYSSYIQNVTNRILQETTENIVQNILSDIRSFVEKQSIKDLNYTNDVKRKESFLSAILSFCQDMFKNIFKPDQKIGQYLNENPQQKQLLDSLFQRTAKSISESVMTTSNISSHTFLTKFKNNFDSTLDLESIEGSIDVSVSNTQITTSVIKTFEEIDLIGKIFQNISELHGIQIADHLQETSLIKSVEILKTDVEHERVTDIFGNLFGIVAISGMLLLGGLVFIMTPTSSASSSSYFSPQKKIKFKIPVVSKVKTIESRDEDLISSGGYLPIENQCFRVTENNTISEDMLITDVLFNDSKFE